MGFAWRDNLISLISSLGQFGRDPAASSAYALDYTLDRGQLEAAYRGNWIARKCVDIPADDATRMWRRWIAEDEDVTKLEQCEKTLHMRQRMRDVIKKSRLYGGAVLIMGIEGTGNFWDELNVDDVEQGALKFIHVVTRDLIIAGPIIRDLGNPWFGHPQWYQRMSGVVPAPANKVEAPKNYLGLEPGEQLDIHPSRVIRFTGLDYPDAEQAPDCWGDSVLQPVNSAIKAAGIVTQSVAGLTNKAAVDLIKIPDLGNKLSTTEGTAELFKRFSAAQDGKSVLNALLLDINEEWEQMTVHFGGLPQVLEMYLSIAAGAVDIPATRFLSQSPKGLNATGESDQRNYYDRVKSDQEMRLTPAMTPLDEVLIRHALGARDPEIDYEWKSLWMMNDHEKAELWWKKAQAHKIDVDAGLVPPDALRIARENQLIEDGVYPGLEQALDDCAQEDKDDIDEANLLSITGGETHQFAGGPMTPEVQKQQLKMSTALVPRPPPPGKPKTLGGGPAAGGPRRDASPFDDAGFDPGEPRDPHGQWEGGGGGGSGGGGGGSEHYQTFRLSHEYLMPGSGLKKGVSVVKAPNMEHAARQLMAERGISHITINSRSMSAAEPASQARPINQLFELHSGAQTEAEKQHSELTSAKEKETAHNIKAAGAAAAKISTADPAGMTAKQIAKEASGLSGHLFSLQKAFSSQNLEHAAGWGMSPEFFNLHAGKPGIEAAKAISARRAALEAEAKVRGGYLGAMTEKKFAGKTRRDANPFAVEDIGWTEEAREAALETRRAHAAGVEGPPSREQKVELVKAYARLARAERIAARKNRGKKGAKGGLKASGAVLGYGEGAAFGSELSGDAAPDDKDPAAS